MFVHHNLKKWGKNGKMVNSSLRQRHGHLGKFLINCESGVSPSGVFMCTIAGNYSVLHATVVVLGNNGVCRRF